MRSATEHARDAARLEAKVLELNELLAQAETRIEELEAQLAEYLVEA